ncbi:MAG TPA: hypothetical protein VFG83_16315 [Kofleriaceae bacterium]|nr:hypothetical protein [Kofleriaceae bacterium]
MRKIAKLACLAGALVIAPSACGDDSSPVTPDAPPQVDAPVEPDAALGHDGVGRNAACETPGVACTWLGIPGENGFNGDGHHRLDTKVSLIQHVLFHSDGTVWFSDFNNYLIRKVLPDGSVVSVVGTTKPIFPGDGPLGGIPPEGAAGADWSLNHPTNLLENEDGSVLLDAWHNHKLLTINSETGWVTVFSGSGGGFAGDGSLAAKGALYKQPSDVTFGDDGSLYIVDQQNQRVRMIDPDGILSTIGGTGTPGFSGDGGLATEAEFYWAYGSNPNPSGGIVYKDDVLYIADTENNRIRTIDLATGMVNTLAGNGEAKYAGDGGPAADASLRAPRDLAFGPDGDLYIADTDNSVVRAINLESGEIRTVVGTGELGLDEEEALPATETTLRRPMGISFDPDGNLYVMDTLNDRVVRVKR